VFFVRNSGCALFDIEVFMKVLIWIACFFTTALIQTLFGMKLGGIPAAMFFGATFSIAKNFVARYDNRNNKTSKKYAETAKGLMKGFLWYGASIFYVILGTIFVSADPASFDFGTQIIIAILCIGAAIAGHILIDKKVQLKYFEENEAETLEEVEINDKICFCRKCGTNLEEDSRFCRKCGTEIKEEQQ
jgi:ribosomal protein L40E